MDAAAMQDAQMKFEADYQTDPSRYKHWRLSFDGVSVTLEPSIGNWNFPCQSHYWIRRNRVVWARRWHREEIEASQLHDRLVQERYFGDADNSNLDDGGVEVGRAREGKSGERLWRKLKGRLSQFVRGRGT